MLVRFST